MTEDEYDPANPNVQSWHDVYRQVSEVMAEFGTEGTMSDSDYWVHDDYWGYPQIKVYFHSLRLLIPPLVTRLKAALRNFPDHEIMVAIAVRGGEHWPDMGLTIRAHEIIDGLQRHHFPVEYRDVVIPGSRPGTEDDWSSPTRSLFSIAK